MAIVGPRADSAPSGPTARNGSDWRRALTDPITDPSELCQRLGLPASLAAAAGRAGRDFPLLVPRPFLGRIRFGDPDDPLLAQVLPREEELHQPAGFTKDPVGESRRSPEWGLLRKYRSRVVILATGACAVHCRFCFRRHFPYFCVGGLPLRWETALRQIDSDPSIREVILSGGDPLSLEDDLLGWLAGRLAGIRHLRRLRVHSRIPLLIPQRVTGEFLATLRQTRLTPLVVVHVNHPAEIDEPAAWALSSMVDAGVPVLSK
jgi:KamA family protein